ncbi:MAG TPA: ATP-binding protein [Thermoleophilaceae bacterium]|nr:ATP-binding protein [Thermoleophilaceae bacterium]
MRRLSIGRAVRAGLFGVTVLLGVVSALAVAGIFEARQDYEDKLADSYELQVSAGRLLTAGVLEAAVLQRRDARAVRARALAREAFEEEARTAARLARADPQSAAIVRRRIAAQERARRAARADDTSDPLGTALVTARELSRDLSERQGERREEARDEASDDTRDLVIAAVATGLAALVGALLLIGLLVASMRRPLDQLVGATGKLAGGELESRVEPSGPRELRDLAESFNTMAGELDSAQQRLLEERRRLAVTIESLGDALVVAGADGTVASINPRARELVPALTPGAPTQGPGSPLPERDEALRQEVLVDTDERILAVTAAELEGGADGGGVVWTIRDVSERARLERLKSEFVATASHELRSPLTSIKGFVELLARSEGLDKKQREFLDVILLSTNRLVDLVNDLLDVARIEAGQFEIHTRATDVVEAVREVATLLEPRIADKNQTLDLDLPRILPPALADPGRLRQIITNLLTNAHLYTPPGGEVGVRLEAAERAIVVTVSDTGRGMTRDEQEHIFDRFYRGSDGRTAPGTGLGLSVVKSLVDLHGGNIEVESEPDRGSVFRVFLPRQPLPEGGPLPREALRGRRVLVVDDEPDIAELIAVNLEPYEVETMIAHSGAEALEHLRRERFDAVTLDILMPGMSGFEVLEEVRADPSLSRTPVVFVSVYSGREALAGEWTVAKPIDAEQLTDALGSAVLAGRTRVLVVGRGTVKPRLEPALERLGLDHDWTTSGAGAARLCREHRYEVALVDAGVRSPQTVLRGLDLRGRRRRRAVLLFTSGDEHPGLVATFDGDPVPIEEAATAVLQVLSQTPED